MYVDFPEYNAILFRKTYTDLSLPGALMDVSKEWLTNSPAKWNELKKVWIFPSGATLSFGYLDNTNAKYRYQGSQFHFIGLDEVSQIDEASYRYLFSRLRQERDSKIPMRMLSATNPPQLEDGMWVYRRFVADATPIHSFDPQTKQEYVHYRERRDESDDPSIPTQTRAFVPALLADNPYIHQASYLNSMGRLDWVTREQLLYGEWLVRPEGGIFKQEWFKQWYDPTAPPEYDEMLISCDLAFKDTSTADYTVYQAWGRAKGLFYLIDQVRGKWTFPKAKSEFRKFCARHPGIHRKIIEDKAAGISMLQDLKDDVPGLMPYNPKTKSKMERAQLISPLFEDRKIILPKHRSWVDDFVAEHIAFNGKTGHDDQVDACSQALLKLKKDKQKFFVGSF